VSDEAWLGLDLGTQSARALAVSPRGEVLAAAARPLRSRRDGPRHEQDPDDWWTALAGAAREALDGLGAEVRGLATCGTSGTICLLDAAGRPLTPGLMYDDARAGGELTDAVNEAGAEVWDRLGYRMQPSWALPKLAWLAGEGAFEAGARVAHQVDVVTSRLLGEPAAADTSNALKTGYDLLEERWPADVLDALGIAPAVLPGVVRAGARLGEVCADAAAATGVPAGTPVIAGMTDSCAAQLAAGALREGDWNSVLGTTLALKGVTGELVRDPLGVVYSHRAPDGGWLPGGASSVGAGVLAREFEGRDLAALDRAASEHEPAGAVAYPLVSRGERFPFTAPEAEAFMLGEPAGEADRYAAVLQGVAHVERLCLDYLDLLGAPVDGELSLTGGATRSAYWCQLRADVLGRPVRLPAEAEAALGMAVLAAAHGRTTAEAAAEMVRVRAVLEPRADRTERFREPYVRLVEALGERGWIGERVVEHARARAAA